MGNGRGLVFRAFETLTAIPRAFMYIMAYSSLHTAYYCSFTNLFPNHGWYGPTVQSSRCLVQCVPPIPEVIQNLASEVAAFNPEGGTSVFVAQETGPWSTHAVSPAT